MIELPQNREQRRRALKEEKRETRHQLIEHVGREAASKAIIPDHLFPLTVRRAANRFSAQLRRARHEIHYIENHDGMLEVVCSDECGFVVVPFVEEERPRSSLAREISSVRHPVSARVAAIDSRR